MDFMNRGMLFAARLLLCFFPFLIVANALAGRSVTAGLTRRLGLNQQAAADVSHLFTSSAATSGAITGTAWVFFILGGIAAAAAIRDLYERAFDLDRRGAKDMILGELPRVFRTGNLRLIHATSCPFRYSLRTSCGVR